MRIIFKCRAVRTWALIIATSLLLISIGYQVDLEKSEWSGWAQAVGAIAAIFASVAITNHQISKQRAFDRAKETANDRRIAEFARTIIEDALANIRATRKEQMTWQEGLDYRFYSEPRIQASLVLIRSLVSEPLFPELMSPVIDTHGLLIAVESFSKQSIGHREIRRSSRFHLYWNDFDKSVDKITEATNAAMEAVKAAN